jgi:hypothetical protein
MIAAIGVIIVLLLVLQLTGTPARVGVTPALLGVLLILLLFVSLTVEIKDQRLTCSFGPGLIRRSIALSDIRDVRAVRNPWVLGWGIRWMPGGYWLWNVSGLDAVELTLATGAKFRIGTDEPDALVQAIQRTRSAVI